MTLDPSRIAALAALAADLWTLHDRYNSWRKVQRLHYPTVSFATLNRIARTNGERLPGDRKILKALGLTGSPEQDEIRKYKRAMTRLLKWIRS